jgi:energy-coupling factor transporter ATP-binding protein EcfA2
MTLGPGEPPAGPWRIESLLDFARTLLETAGHAVDRPRVVAVDGRGGSGKTTLCELLHGVVPSSAVVHTDDVAWHLSFFAWDEVLASEVLEPLRRGETVSYVPRAHHERSWPGTIRVADGLEVVFVEGTGVARRELQELVDAVIWVQSDVVEAERRGVAREGGDQAAVDFWNEWMAEELPFLQDQRPWERADFIVCGTSAIVHDPVTELVVAPALPP